MCNFSGLIPGAILLDFDGVCIDTDNASLAAWRCVYEKFGVETDVIDIHFWKTHGKGKADWTELLKPLTRNATLSDGDIHDIRRTLRNQYIAQDGLNPHLFSLLAIMRQAGIKSAIVSNAPLAWLERWTRHFGIEDLDGIYSSDQINMPKPSPDVYELALEKLSIDTCNALAVEDSALGIRAAQAAGITTLAYATIAKNALQIGTTQINSIDEITVWLQNARH